MPRGQQHRDSFKAAAGVTPKRKDRHRPGYVPPVKINAQYIGAYLQPPLAEAFRLVVKAEGSTIQEMIRGFVVEKTKEILSPEIRAQIVEQEIARVRARYGQSLTSTLEKSLPNPLSRT